MVATSGIRKSKLRGTSYSTWRIGTGIIASVNDGEHFTITNATALPARMKVAAPVDADDVTTKAYVDGRSSALSSLLSELVNPERFGMFARANCPYLHDGIPEASVEIPEAEIVTGHRELAISANGLVVLLWDSYADEYSISRDGGNTFKTSASPVSFTPSGIGWCRMSYDGCHVFITGYHAVPSEILVSHDYGATFTAVYGPDGASLGLLDCSYDGKYVYGQSLTTPAATYRSEDYGDTFAALPTTATWQCEKNGMSADGRVVMLHSLYNIYSALYLSTDFGENFAVKALDGVVPYGGIIVATHVTEDGRTLLALACDYDDGTLLKSNWRLLISRDNAVSWALLSFPSISAATYITPTILASWNGQRIVVAFGLATTITIFNIVAFSDIFESVTPTLATMPAIYNIYDPTRRLFLTGDGSMLFVTVPVAGAPIIVTTYAQLDPATPLVNSKNVEAKAVPSGQLYSAVGGQEVYSRDGYNSVSQGFYMDDVPLTQFFFRRKYTPILETRRPQLTLNDKGTLAPNQYEDGLIVILEPGADFAVDLLPALSFIGKRVTFVKFSAGYTVTINPASGDGIEAGNVFYLAALGEKVTLTAISPAPGTGLWMIERDVPIRNFCASAEFTNSDPSNPADFVLGIGEAGFAGILLAFQGHYQGAQSGNWGAADVKLQVCRSGVWSDLGPNFTTTAVAGDTNPVVSAGLGMNTWVLADYILRAYITLPPSGSFSAMIDVTLGQRSTPM